MEPPLRYPAALLRGSSLVIAPLFSLFDITDEEKIIKASSFLGCSTEEIEKALAEAGQ